MVVEGVEADDVIGTLACQATAQGVRTVVSTGDKDLAQLVNDHVTLVNTMSGEVLDPPGVVAKFGVPPERIVDYLSLIGDAVDNVPGVPKVGPKTAVKWLTEYGTLDSIMAGADGIKGVVGENLRNTLDWLPRARRAGYGQDRLRPQRRRGGLPRAARAGRGQREAGRLLLALWLQDLAARGHGRVLPNARAAARSSRAGAAPAPSPQGGLFDGPADASADLPAPDTTPAEIRYETVTTEAALDAWIARIIDAPLTAIDTETTSLDPMQAQLVGLSLSVEPGEAAYIPVAHRGPDVAGMENHGQLSREYVLERLRPWLEDPARPKLGQHLKYDAHVFANHGVKLRGIAQDTMLESYVLASHRNHGMDSLAERLLNLKTHDLRGSLRQGRRARSASTRSTSSAPPSTRPRMRT